MALLLDAKALYLLNIIQEKLASYGLPDDEALPGEPELLRQAKRAVKFLKILQCFLDNLQKLKASKGLAYRWSAHEITDSLADFDRLLAEQKYFLRNKLRADSELYFIKYCVDGVNQFPYIYLVIKAFANLEPRIQRSLFALVDAFVAEAKIALIEASKESASDKSIATGMTLTFDDLIKYINGKFEEAIKRPIKPISEARNHVQLFIEWVEKIWQRAKIDIGRSELGIKLGTPSPSGTRRPLSRAATIFANMPETVELPPYPKGPCISDRDL